MLDTEYQTSSEKKSKEPETKDFSTIVLRYDASDPIATKTLDFILSLGVFEKSEKTAPVAEEPEGVPQTKRISKFGQMMGSYRGKIQEIGNVWDL